ncbi:MAG: lipid II flippase MurJ [Kineosporiaceae bacterium]
MLAAVVVPLLASGLSRGDDDGRRRADQVASALLTWVLAVLVPLALVVGLAARPLAALLIGTGQAVPGSVDLGADLLRLFAAQLPLYGVGAVLGGVLQAHRRFLGPALAPLASSLVMIAAYGAFAASLRGGADGLVDPLRLETGPRRLLGRGTTLGVAALTLPLFVPVRRAGVRLRPTFALPADLLRPALSLAGAGVAGVLAQQASVLAVALVTRGVDEGRVVTLLSYAQAVTMLPFAVLVVPVITTTFPRLAHVAALGREDDFARLTARALRGVTVVSVVGAAVLVAVAGSVEHFFTALDRSHVTGLAVGLVAGAPGVVGLAVTTACSRALAAAHRARDVASGVVVGWLLTACGSAAVLVPGVDAVAGMLLLGLASSLGMLTSAWLLLLAVRRHCGATGVRGVPGAGLASVLAALPAAAAGAAAGAGVHALADPGGRGGTAAWALASGAAAALVCGALGLGLVALLLPEVRRDLTAQLGRRRRRAVVEEET